MSGIDHAAAAPSEPRTQSPLALPAFRWFFAARLVSLLGSAMTPVALAFAILAASDSARDLSLVLTAHTVPLVAFVILGGALADRFRRDVILRTANLGAALTQGAVAYLLISGHYQLTAIIALEFVNGMFEAFTTPALRGVVPDLVPRTAIQKANSLLSSTRSATRIIGPSIAGLLVATVGGGWAIAVDALTFLVAALCMSRLALPGRPAGSSGSLLTGMREGWTYFRSLTWVWSIVVAFTLMNAIQVGIWSVLGPAIARATFGEASWGFVLGLKALGLTLMGLVMYRLTIRRLLTAGQLAIALTAIPLIVLGLDAGVGWLAATAFLAGVGSAIFGVAWDSSLQEHIPRDLLSRVASFDDFGSYVAIPVGQLAVVPLAAVAGEHQVAFIGGILYLVLALAPLAVPAVRRLTHPV